MNVLICHAFGVLDMSAVAPLYFSVPAIALVAVTVHELVHLGVSGSRSTVERTGSIPLKKHTPLAEHATDVPWQTSCKADLNA